MNPLIANPAQQAPAQLVVALVEDDFMLRQEIEVHLKGNGFDVHATHCATGLDDLNARIPFDLYLIDLNLPGEDGLSLCRRIRASNPDRGIVIMTARVGLNDRIAGYKDGGADFYLTKPSEPDELVMVLKSLGRRIRQTPCVSDWTLSLRDRTLLGPGSKQKLRLTSREKMILLAMVQGKDNIVEWDALFDLFTKYDARHDDAEVVSKRAIEEIVSRLRKKLRSIQLDDDEAAIKSVWGAGYQLCVKVKFSN